MIKIALLHPDIPQNTGNIGRLCVGLEAELHLIRPMGFVIDDKKVKRAGLDYWQHVQLTIHDSFEEFLAKFPGSRKFFLTTKTKTLYTEMRYQKGDFLILGAESRGIPEEILKQFCPDTITIPQFGPVRSLNVSNAAAIVAYEAVRQIQMSRK